MNRLPAVAVFLAVTLFAGCATVDSSERSAEVSGPAPAHIYDTILEIQRQVEMKAGLPMGVAIHDDRAKLAGLYKEARQIDRELLRRYNGGDDAARVETVKAVY